MKKKIMKVCYYYEGKFIKDLNVPMDYFDKACEEVRKKYPDIIIWSLTCSDKVVRYDLASNKKILASTIAEIERILGNNGNITINFKGMMAESVTWECENNKKGCAIVIGSIIGGIISAVLIKLLLLL